MIFNRDVFLEKASEKTIFEDFKDEEASYQELYKQWLIENEDVLKRGKITE